VGGCPAFSVRVGAKLATAAAKDKADGWVELAGQLDAAGRVRLLVNGKSAARAKAPGPLTAKPQDGLQIGCDSLSSVADDPGSRFFAGLIEHTRVTLG
ncbi:MAG TPA: LamG-like jellyroll fold domain-containing protein, partial [Phycisphaerae bacterium]|nr:LamG-like jellyroll fold domain-containing protein [Phycisphaerae bacterium]